MIIGTAGHIDHGKTALLRALTGVEGDQRPEERERGLTVDLGYRYADLGNGELTAFIDVPGHERLVHNMVAGASGIDLLLLVVAADDGVMPQTREHVAIAELLGIRQAVVAITKIDRVEPLRLAVVGDEVVALLATGALREARQFPVSSATGAGIDALRSALQEMANATARPATDGGFRLPVDRAFSVAGAGVVVTGTARAGRVEVGDELYLSPAGRRVRVRGLRAQNQIVESATAGQRVALNLAGERLAVAQCRRGDWLVDPSLHAPTHRIDIELRLLVSEPRPLQHWTPVHVHHGSQHLTARVALLDGEPVPPGGVALAQLLLNAPIHAVTGDPLVLRDQSARRTLGGGRVLDPFAPARDRRSPARLAQLRALHHGTLEQALPALLAHTDNGLDVERLQRQFNRLPSSWELPAVTTTVRTRAGARLFAEEHWQRLGEQLEAALQRFHAEQPDEPGADRDRLRRYALPALERPVFLALLETRLAAQTVEQSGPWLHLPGFQPQLSEAEESLAAQLEPLLVAGGNDPPWVRDLARSSGAPESEVRQLLRKLARQGRLHQVVKDLFYPPATLAVLAALVEELSRNDGVIHTAAFRDRSGLGRKRAIQLLEYFDRIGISRRAGELRRLRPDFPGLMATRAGTDARANQ